LGLRRCIVRPEGVPKFRKGILERGRAASGVTYGNSVPRALRVSQVFVIHLFSDSLLKGLNSSQQICASGQGRLSYTPHVLKHSLASHLVAGNVNLALVRQALGHRSINSTMQYIGTSDGQAAVAGVLQGKAFAERLPSDVVEYCRNLVRWVRAQSFNGLISAIYREYPEYKVNSIFQE
jgi:integrase